MLITKERQLFISVRFILTKWEAPIGPFDQMRSSYWSIWSKQNGGWLMNVILDIFRYLLYDIFQICNHKKVKSVNKWPLYHKSWWRGYLFTYFTCLWLQIFKMLYKRYLNIYLCCLSLLITCCPFNWGFWIFCQKLSSSCQSNYRAPG